MYHTRRVVCHSQLHKATKGRSGCAYPSFIVSAVLPQGTTTTWLLALARQQQVQVYCRDAALMGLVQALLSVYGQQLIPPGTAWYRSWQPAAVLCLLFCDGAAVTSDK